MISAGGLRLGSLLRWALSERERLGGDPACPEAEEAWQLLDEQSEERERFEAWCQAQEAADERDVAGGFGRSASGAGGGER